MPRHHIVKRSEIVAAGRMDAEFFIGSEAVEGYERHDDRPVHQPPAYDAPIPGIHFYAGCEPGGDMDLETGRYTGSGPRVNPDGICEGCGEPACPICGKGGESVSCPECGEGRVHRQLSCCGCGLRWDDLETTASYWKEKVA